MPAAVITVTNTNDSGPGSLRDALAVANDGDTIDVTSVSGSILLTSGELQITHNVTINGPGAGSLSVNGNATFRVFESFASSATISRLTVTNGSANELSGGGGILNHGGLTLVESIVSNSGVPGGNGRGRGISNNPGATLTVTDSMISSNGACQGGGVYTSNAQLTVMNSTINGNTLSIAKAAAAFVPDPICGGSGGGIVGDDGATVTRINSTITGNSGCTSGGVASKNAQLSVINSTISGNLADGCVSGAAPQDLPGNGGGISSFGSGILTVTNSTISGNSASAGGGGIWNQNSLTITNSTISNNVANEGGGICNGGTTTIGHTILNAGDFGGTILNRGTIISLGYNLASDHGGGVLTGPGDQINTNPMLGPLQDNGGPTFTQALFPGSPAINAGDPSFTPPPFYDQRGTAFARVVNGRIDIGSYEMHQPAPTPSPTSTATPSPTARSSPTPRPRLTPRPRP